MAIQTSIEEIYFEIGGLGGYDTYRMTFSYNSAHLVTTPWCGEPIDKHYSSEEVRLLLDAFEDIHVEHWNSEYIDPCVCDGTQWELAVKYEGHRGIVWVGGNAYKNRGGSERGNKTHSFRGGIHGPLPANICSILLSHGIIRTRKEGGTNAQGVPVSHLPKQDAT